MCINVDFSPFIIFSPSYILNWAVQLGAQRPHAATKRLICSPQAAQLLLSPTTPAALIARVPRLPFPPSASTPGDGVELSNRSMLHMWQREI